MKIVRIALPLLVLAVGVAAFAYMQSHKPVPTTRLQAEKQALLVDVIHLQNGSFQPTLIAQGQTSARQQTRISSEVSGKITYIDPVFAEGLLVKAGQLLVQLQEERYSAKVEIAQSSVTQAQAALVEELARAKLALANWQRSGNSNSPSELALRKPQLQAAQARLQVARSQLETARLDLKATRIRAPYHAVVLEASANLGQSVTPATSLGVLMSVDALEAKIPLSGSALKLLPALPIDVEVLTSHSAHRYPARIIRRAAQVDVQTRLLNLIVHIPRPLDYDVPLLPGQYVRVVIPAKPLHQVVTIPLNAISTNHEVNLLRDGLLVRKKVDLLHVQEQIGVVRGLADGDILVTTPVHNLPTHTRLKPNDPPGHPTDSD